jgi:hypothetical protein
LVIAAVYPTACEAFELICDSLSHGNNAPFATDRQRLVNGMPEGLVLFVLVHAKSTGLSAPGFMSFCPPECGAALWLVLTAGAVAGVLHDQASSRQVHMRPDHAAPVLGYPSA